MAITYQITTDNGTATKDGDGTTGRVTPSSSGNMTVTITGTDSRGVETTASATVTVAQAVLDTGDGGIFLADTGFEPDHDSTFVREYQVEGDATVRTMYRPSSGSGDLEIKLAGYRSAQGHDMTGSGRVRFRDTVDGVDQGWTDYRDFTVTSTTATSYTTFDPYGDGSLTATFSAATEGEVCSWDTHTLFVWNGGSDVTIDSVSPAQAVSAGGRAYNGAGVNVPGMENPFLENDVVTYSTTYQASIPVTLSPGDIFVKSVADETSLDSGSNNPARGMLCIVCLSERPPKDMFAPSCYGGTPAQVRARTMMHGGLVNMDRIPDLTTSTGYSSTTIDRFAPAFRRGTTETRALFPSWNLENVDRGATYHGDYAAAIHRAIVIAMDDSNTDAKRLEYARYVCQHMIHQAEHVAQSRHNYWDEGHILFAGTVLGIPEWQAARRSWIYQAPSYDASGNVATNLSQPPADDADSNRFQTWASMGSAYVPWNDPSDPIVPALLKSERTVTFSPSTPDDEPRLPGVVDNGDGTWTIPAERGFFGDFAFRNRACVLDPRPDTPGTYPTSRGSNYWASVPVDGAESHTTHWTDTANGPGKSFTYNFQHNPKPINNFMVAAKLGKVEYLNVLYVEDVAKSHMGITQEWLDQISLYGNYNGGKINGNTPAQGGGLKNINTDEWWSVADDYDANGGLFSSKSVPGKLPRSRFELADKSNEADIGITLKAYPDDDGNDPIDKWEYRIDGGTAVEVSNPYIGVETVGTSAGTGSRTVEIRLHNAQGWGAWSEPKSITVAQQIASITETRLGPTDQATSDGDIDITFPSSDVQVGDVRLVVIGRGTANDDVTPPASFTDHQAYNSGARTLEIFTQVVDSGNLGTHTYHFESGAAFRDYYVRTFILRPNSGSLSPQATAEVSDFGAGSGVVTRDFPQITGVAADSLLVHAIAVDADITDVNDAAEDAPTLPAPEGFWAESRGGDVRIGILIKHNDGSDPSPLHSVGTDPGNAGAAATLEIKGV